MKVLLLRSIGGAPTYATFDQLATKGVGGTEFQLLLHARALRTLGHDVAIFGVAAQAGWQEGIWFEASCDATRTLQVVDAAHSDTDVVLINSTGAIEGLRRALPSSMIVQVCQNGPHFSLDPYIDYYAFVGYGTFAHHCGIERSRRNKFVMLPNVPPWHASFQAISPDPSPNQIIWVGGFGKQGLRRWGRALAPILKERQDLRWLVCGPSYEPPVEGHLPPALCGLSLPPDRVTAINFPMATLGQAISRSRMLLASLGGEDGPVSYLDGHALGVPVLCGNDIVGKFATPDGTGIRCVSVSDCREAVAWILDNPDGATAMGVEGRAFVALHHTEAHQAAALSAILTLCGLRRQGLPIARGRSSDRKRPLWFYYERLQVKLAERRLHH